MHEKFPSSVTRLIDAFSRLPGIGRRTATRLAFHLIRQPEFASRDLGEAALALKSSLKLCPITKNIIDEHLDFDPIYSDANRDRGIICVVEEPLDILAFEQAGGFRGVYHVLHGVLNPLDGIGPEQLAIGDLLARIQKENPAEIILAMNPSMEGEATALFIARQLGDSPAKITRLARGLPTGSELSFSDALTLQSALANRRDFGVR